MDITCPHCNFAKSVDPAKVPDRPVKVNCPKCKQAFSFDKTTQLADAPAEKSPVDAPKAATEQAPPTPPVTEGRRIICNACGTVQAPTDQCVHCGATIVTTANPVHNLSYAGFWIRAIAYTLDSFIIGGVQLVLGLVLGFSLAAMGGLNADGETTMGIVTWLFGAVLGIAYAVFFTGYCGQTPGKMALRIKVVMTDGGDITYGNAAMREVVGKFISGILLGIGYLMVAFDDKKQGLHDRLAKTYVIKL